MNRIYFVGLAISGSILAASSLLASELDVCIWTSTEPGDALLDYRTPVLVSYANGFSVRATDWEKFFDAYHVESDPNYLKIISDLVSIAQKHAGIDYNVTHSTDAPHTTVLTRKGKISIYGEWDSVPVLSAENSDSRINEINQRIHVREMELWNAFPKDLRRALNAVKNYQSRSKKNSFRPERISVNLSLAWEVRKEKIPYWPMEDLAGIKKKILVHPDKDRFNFIVSGNYLDELKSLFTSNGKDYQLVMIDEQPYLIKVLYLFPCASELIDRFELEIPSD